MTARTTGRSLLWWFARLALRLLRATRLSRLARRARTSLPSAAKRWLDAREVDLRVRGGGIASHAYPDWELVPVRQLERSYRDALRLLSETHGSEDIGDYLEFGVYAGASMACMHRATHDSGLDHVRLFGFDSFEGLPSGTVADLTGEINWQPGDFAADEATARRYLAQHGVDVDRVTLVKGWFDDTLTRDFIDKHSIRKASVIMVDCDMYSSARTALEFSAPLIEDKAVIFFDDWWPDELGSRDLGEKRAFDEFLLAHPEFSAEELESYYPRAAKVFLVSVHDGHVVSPPSTASR